MKKLFILAAAICLTTASFGQTKKKTTIVNGNKVIGTETYVNDQRTAWSITVTDKSDKEIYSVSGTSKDDYLGYEYYLSPAHWTMGINSDQGKKDDVQQNNNYDKDYRTESHGLIGTRRNVTFVADSLGNRAMNNGVNTTLGSATTQIMNMQLPNGNNVTQVSSLKGNKLQTGNLVVSDKDGNVLLSDDTKRQKYQEKDKGNRRSRRGFPFFLSGGSTIEGSLMTSAPFGGSWPYWL
ncbi:MAG TPA: hypothetical protein VG694_02440 [Candidatus Paceibacterota bacterium]|nr:hypothetical protein [Candidatus Paceibacterota bacterium]